VLRKFSILLTLAGLLIVFASIQRAPTAASAQTEATPTTDPAMGDELDEPDEMEMGDEHTHGERIDAGGATIRIAAPADGAMINTSSTLVKVDTTNYPLGEGKHWHLYVDGAERGMSQGNSDTMAANDLEPGEHVIEVVLSNDLHQELEATHSITIHVEGEGASHETAAGSTDNSLLIVGGVVLAIAVVAGAGYVATRRK